MFKKVGLKLGIGDDCAVWRPATARDLVFTTDWLVENVHFRRSTNPASAIGHKALARGLSDLAAMGARPEFCLLSLALPPETPRTWIRQYFSGFFRLAARVGIVLAGGDLSKSGVVVSDIVACGSVPRGRALERSRSRPGDRIFVSGRLGGSAAGLRLGSGAAWRKHLRPEPRLALGQILLTKWKATAAMDLSDGLSLDLARMAKASGAAASITAPPIFPKATLDEALHGGEDYELLFTVKPGTRVPKEFEGVELTEIGTIEAGRPGRVLLNGRPLAAGGWDHWRER